MADANDLLFLRVVEAGSLKAAAEQIGADPSAVSRRIAALEERLGVRLLQRSTKRSTPTDAGQRYYEGMRRLSDAQSALEAEVAGLTDKPAGRLRVAAPVDFGARFVAPVLAELQDDAPDLAVDLLLGSGFADLIEEGIDVAVRIGRLPDSRLIAKRVGEVPRVIVAARRFVEAHGEPAAIEDLRRFPFIFYGSGQRELSIEIGRNGESQTATVRGSFTANSVTAIRALVDMGRGLHLGPVWAFEDGLADGSLVRVLPDCPLRSFPLHALYAPSPYMPAKSRVFIDRFAAAIAGEPSLR
ncbi:MAG: LysR family transcriptional regulator [Pseudomonadota bacterium]